MFLQTIIYLLMFTSMACFGFKKLSKYTEFEKTSIGGAVFGLAPTEEYKVKGVVGKQQVGFYHVEFPLLVDGQDNAGGRLMCNEFPEKPTYNRLSIRVVGHAYFAGEVELDEFVVVECNKDKLRNMFEGTKVGGNKYFVTFKDTYNQCYKREIEVIEDELKLTVRRKEPVQHKCLELNNSMKTQDGQVRPKSWMDNGDLFDLPDSAGSKFKMPGDSKEELEEAYYYICSTAKIDDQSFYVVTVYYKGIPIDRVVVQACMEFLSKSMYMEKRRKSAPNEIYVKYYDTKKNCLRRKYEVIDSFVDGDSTLRRVVVKRSPPVVERCLKLKMACMIYRMYFNVDKKTSEVDSPKGED